MLSTSALTWAATQINTPTWELIRGLSPTDEARIEAAYAEWRRRAAAGERRHKVDWRTYPLPDEPAPAAPVPAVPLPAVDAIDAAEDAPVPAEEESVAAEPAEAAPVPAVDTIEADEDMSVHIMETNETAEAAPVPTEEEMEAAEAEEAAIAAMGTDPYVAYAMEQIMAVEETEPEYISLDDFNLEPSEAEMQEMDALIHRDEPEDLVSTEGDDMPVEVVASAEAPHAAETAPAEVAVSTVAEVAASPEKAEVELAEPAAVAEPERSLAAVPEGVEQRISRLPKDATPSAYADLLAALGNDVSMAKMVTEAVIRDHTRRHRGTAAQRAFLAWLEKRA